jgi:hypothetical protein
VPPQREHVFLSHVIFVSSGSGLSTGQLRSACSGRPFGKLAVVSGRLFMTLPSAESCWFLSFLSSTVPILQHWTTSVKCYQEIKQKSFPLLFTGQDRADCVGCGTMESNVRSFARPVTPGQPVMPGRMVRVVDLSSPFFSWEGWVKNAFTGNDTRQYVQIICAHSGFQFPALTFSTEQVTDV